MRDRRAALSSPKRILVISPVFGGSFPIAVESAFALQTLGHEVGLCDMRAFAGAYAEAAKAGSQHAQRAFYAQVRGQLEAWVSRQGTQLLLALAQAPVRADFLQDLRASGVASAMWYVEPFERFSGYRAIAPHYDWFFRIEESPFDRLLDELGVPDHAYLPLGARHALLDEEADPPESGYRSPLSFFGSPYANRIQILSPLANRGLSLWGKGWSGVPEPLASCVRDGDAFLDAMEEQRVYRGADIVLNPHSQGPKETQRDFLNPRVFQAAAMGRFQLTDARTLLRRHFERDEVVDYASAADLRAKVDHYLAHPEERRAIAERARARVRAEHTYLHRMEALLARVFPVPVAVAL